MNSSARISEPNPLAPFPLKETEKVERLFLEERETEKAGAPNPFN